MGGRRASVVGLDSSVFGEEPADAVLHDVLQAIGAAEVSFTVDIPPDERAKALNDVLRRVRFRNRIGWEFTVMGPTVAALMGYPHTFGDQVVLHVRAAFADVVDNPERLVQIVDTKALPPGCSPAEMLEILWQVIRSIEDHERLEQLLIDGQPIWAPHTPDPAWPRTGKPHYGPHGKPYLGADPV